MTKVDMMKFKWITVKNTGMHQGFEQDENEFDKLGPLVSLTRDLSKFFG